MKLDNLNNSSARTMGSEWDVDSLNSYVNRIKELAKTIKETNHPLLCKKCKSNSWNMLKRRTKFRIQATCTKCKNVQIMVKDKLEHQFCEERIA